MRRNRGTIAIDKELLESLKAVANSKNIPLSKYLNSLFNEAIAIERLGLHAPRALSEKKIEYFLENMGFILLPKEMLKAINSDTVKGVGKKIGLLLKEVDIDPSLLIEYLSKYLDNVIMDSNKLILMKSSEPAANALISIIKEIARISQINVVEDEGIIVIELPKEKYSKELEEFNIKGKSV